MPAIAFAIQIIESLPQIITLTEDAAKYISDSVASLKLMQSQDRDPTPEEWAALDATIEELRASRPDLS